MITSNILQRTFKIQFEDSQATCFTIDHENRQYIVTARHLVGSIVDESNVKIMQGDAWKNLPVKLVGHTDGDVDISVLAADIQISPTHLLNLTLDGMGFGHDAYFLGFPYGLGSDTTLEINRNFPLPFVKKAIISQISFDEGMIMLDGHNNPGFSGGPVVFYPENNRSKGPSVAGVVAGYRHALEYVYPDQELKGSPIGYYKYNTGIVVVYDINHVLNLIRQNPIGVGVKV